MKTALLVIDYINGIMEGSCSEYASKHPIVHNTNLLIKECRNKNIPIYFIRLAFAKNYKKIPKHSKVFNYIKEHNLFTIDSYSSEFIPQLDINNQDVIINKTGASPFHGNNLKEQLKEIGIEKLIFSGVATDNAINIGVREAHDDGLYTIIARDACGASSENYHKWSLELLQKIANQIANTKTIVSYI